jgi:glycogen phosphorylase
MVAHIRTWPSGVCYTFRLMAQKPDDSIDRSSFRNKLAYLARNLRWTWRPQVGRVFAGIDVYAWRKARGNPWIALTALSDEAIAAAAADARWVELLESEVRDLGRYVGSRFEGPLHDEAHSIAYFSPEFGLTETLPVYSGGLGILAGDHLKAASDKGLALVGVGLLYRQCYFNQRLDETGWQHEDYPRVSPDDLGLTLQEPTITVDLAGKPCELKIWTARVGRVDLLLLDSDADSNAPEERAITDRLYSGDNEHRLRQEIVLGIGGVRALRATGYTPEVWHLNEGHAGFMGLERAREVATGDGMSFEQALQRLRPSTIFTTHTPLPVAIDVFKRDLLVRYFSTFAAGFDTDVDRLIAAGSSERAPDAFNMAFFGLRIAGRTNGVSKLHGKVSRRLFAELWSETDENDVPISSVTNGVHAPTWVGPEATDLAPSDWDPASGDFSWARDLQDTSLWAARSAARARLVAGVRARLRDQLDSRGAPRDQIEWASNVLDADTLTIGFARRFAQYKRATLMLRDPARLKRLMFDAERPLQIIVAGKAHPKDDGGKELIRRLFNWTLEQEVRGRLVFLEDYDMELGRLLTQGVDVWLNNPRRPLEACGTSGMKAIMNGVPNFSILDGWWAEMYESGAGWAIGDSDVSEDTDAQDTADAESLYKILEGEVIPEFYETDDRGIPVAWVNRMRGAWALGPKVAASRMMDDYVRGFYLPALTEGEPA